PDSRKDNPVCSQYLLPLSCDNRLLSKKIKRLLHTSHISCVIINQCNHCYPLLIILSLTHPFQKENVKMRDTPSFLLFVKFKPELYSVFIIFYPVILMEGFHDGLDNRKSDSISSIFSGSCLVHFIKFLPDVFDILLRYRLPCIEDADPYLTIPLFNPDIHDPVFIHMVQSITYIV